MRRKLLIALALIPVWVLVGEGLVRVVFWARGEAYSAAETRQALLDARSGMLEAIPGMDERPRPGGRPPGRERGGVVTAVHPYVGWDVTGDQISNELKRYQSGAFDKTFEVLIVGGSVSALTCSKGGASIVRVLQSDERLRQRGAILLNHGRGSFKQPQLTMKVAYLFNLGYRPDAVILIDGFNEVALGVDNVQLGAHPVYPHWGRFGPLAGGRGRDEQELRRYGLLFQVQDRVDQEVDRALGWHLDKSAITGRWARSRVSHLRRIWSDLQDEIGAARESSAGDRDPAQGEPFPQNPKKAVDAIVESWVESSLQLHAICAARGIPFLHVLQPTLHDEGSKALTPEEIERGTVKESWRLGVELGYPRLREASTRLVEAGVAFLDGTDTFADFEGTTYYDGCHFRGPGMVLFAERVARALLDQLD